MIFHDFFLFFSFFFLLHTEHAYGVTKHHPVQVLCDIFHWLHCRICSAVLGKGIVDDDKSYMLSINWGCC